MQPIYSVFRSDILSLSWTVNGLISVPISFVINTWPIAFASKSDQNCSHRTPSWSELRHDGASLLQLRYYNSKLASLVIHDISPSTLDISTRLRYLEYMSSRT